MLATCYRTDPATLVSALSDPGVLARYQDTIAAELPALADRQLVQHLKRMATAASRVLVNGLDQVARYDLHLTDALLSDVLALGLWHGWDLPLERLDEREIALEGLSRGLLGADISIETASVWQLDGTTIAVARTRLSGEDDTEYHKQHHEPGHVCGGGGCGG